MNLNNEFAWISIYDSTDKKQLCDLEKIFYYNKMYCQIRKFGDKFPCVFADDVSTDGEKNIGKIFDEDSQVCYSLWVPSKFEELSRIIVQNALDDNLDKGIIYEKEPETPQDKVRIDHSYEVHIPKKFFWIALAISLSPTLFVLVSRWF